METKIVKLQVTEQDIIDGIPEDDCKCPIALALRRALDNQFTVSVEDGNSICYFTASGIMRMTENFESIHDFIKTFDNHLPVFPFELELQFELEESDYFGE